MGMGMGMGRGMGMGMGADESVGCERTQQPIMRPPPAAILRRFRRRWVHAHVHPHARAHAHAHAHAHAPHCHPSLVTPSLRTARSTRALRTAQG